MKEYMQCATILGKKQFWERQKHGREAFGEERGRKPWGVGWGREKRPELTDCPFLCLFMTPILLLPSEIIN